MAVAYVLALPIGWERERADRSAGIRTFPSLQSPAAALCSRPHPYLEGHPEGRARIIEGVITGMGFIGGGAILKTGDNVRGTATAASLWATGAIGVAAAVEAFQVAIALSVMTLLNTSHPGAIQGSDSRRLRFRDSTKDAVCSLDAAILSLFEHGEATYIRVRVMDAAGCIVCNLGPRFREDAAGHRTGHRMADSHHIDTRDASPNIRMCAR